MGGQHDDIRVFLLDDATADLTTGLAKFDAGKAKCYLDKDRQGLLAVIESSFGTFAPFNKLVRGIFRMQTVTSSGELPSPSRQSDAEHPSSPRDGRDGLAPIHRFFAALGGGLVLRPTRARPKFGHLLLGDIDNPWTGTGEDSPVRRTFLGDIDPPLTGTGTGEDSQRRA